MPEKNPRIFTFVNKKGIYSFVFLIIFLLGCATLSLGQENDVLSLDSLQQNAMSMKVHENSPVKASIYSAVLPGLGQIYTKKYWKVPLVIGGFAAIIYYIDFNSDYYKRYKRYYRDYLAEDPANKSYLELPVFVSGRLSEDDVASGGSYASWFESSLESGKDYYKRNRNLLYVGFVALYIANIVDAAVAAHFKNFDVSDDLSLNIEPVVRPEGFGNFVGLQMKVTF